MYAAGHGAFAFMNGLSGELDPGAAAVDCSVGVVAVVVAEVGAKTVPPAAGPAEGGRKGPVRPGVSQPGMSEGCPLGVMAGSSSQKLAVMLLRKF